MSEFALSFILFLIFIKIFGLIDWSWITVLIPIWLPATLSFFAACVKAFHDWASTPEERQRARLRRHHRNWGL